LKSKVAGQWNKKWLHEQVVQVEHKLPGPKKGRAESIRGTVSEFTNLTQVMKDPEWQASEEETLQVIAM
jgi:hypothetical protein